MLSLALFLTGSLFLGLRFMPKGTRRGTELDVYYLCPNCNWIGYVVTDRYWVSCGQCQLRFAVRGNEVSKFVYQRRFALLEDYKEKKETKDE